MKMTWKTINTVRNRKKNNGKLPDKFSHKILVQLSQIQLTLLMNLTSTLSKLVHNLLKRFLMMTFHIETT